MTAKAKKERLDVLLVERGLAESRSQAQAMIMAGQVYSGQQRMDKAGMAILPDLPLEVRGGIPYVSRGGLKLAHALQHFGLREQVVGKACADIGSSTGGFTDCLLQNGAILVYCIDVGTNQLAWKLRNDPRVVVMEGVNIRYVAHLPEAVQLATIDTSFIGLNLVLPAAARLLTADGWIVALVKPQFEVGREQVGKGGVVREPALHRAVLRDLAAWLISYNQANPELALYLRGYVRSPITGPAGNVEFLAHLTRQPGPPLDVAAEIKQAVNNPIVEQEGSQP